jgi:hypothetical protein
VAIQVKSDGTFAIEYGGAYTGLNVEQPEIYIPDTASPAFNNFMLRNAELRSRPLFQQWLAGPGPGMQGISSFLDANGIYHTVTWYQNLLYQYNPLLPGWSPLLGAPATLQESPIAYRAFVNNIWYTGASVLTKGGMHGGGGSLVVTPFLGYWDGIQPQGIYTQTFADGSTSASIAGISLTDSPTIGGSLPGAPTVVGPMAIGGTCLAELNNQLILGNVSFLDQGTGKFYNYPNMIWWSANGLPLVWDPSTNLSAGFNPMLDVSDQITGIVTLGIAGYIFRQQGITQFSPTGSIPPFTFDHMWASDHGIGNVYPWSIAQYGPSACFIAGDNIYQLSLTTANPIGGKARDAIFSDLANATNTPFAAIIPYFNTGYVYLTYQILIPFLTFVRIYVYSFEDQNWAAWDEAWPGDATSNTPQIGCSPNVV